MNTYKVQVKVPGRIGTPLRGDTIFGHIAWGIARREGEAGISKFLADFDVEPQIVVSSAFPVGYIPMPILSPIIGSFSNPTIYAASKALKKKRFIPLSLIQSGKPLSRSAISASFRDQGPRDIEFSSLHNTVDRFGNGTLEETGLYERAEIWFHREDSDDLSGVLDLYAVSPLPIERVRQLFVWAFESGFGARASTGSGEILLMGVEAVSLPASGNRALALGPFAGPSDKAVSGLRADTFTRRGKVGSEFGSVMNPFKKPIVFFAEGATFDACPGTQYVGRLLQDVHSDRRIRHQGMAPVLLFEENPE